MIKLITFYKINIISPFWHQYTIINNNKYKQGGKDMSSNASDEIPSELKKYINQCFKEYHIKDCLVVLPANISSDDRQLFLSKTDTATKYIIKHIASAPSSDGLCINISSHDTNSSASSTQVGNDQLHELIGEYMSRLATLVEQSTSREPKPAAVWKHRNFLSSISHQIKTPLSAIFSGTKLIKHYTNNEYIDRICEYMNQSCVELTRYMNDIIDFYYLKQGVLVLDDNRVSLSDTVDYVYENYKLQMQDAEIQFIKHIDTGFPNFINCDELRLTQILMNIMDNAVKFSCHPDIESNASSITDTVSDKKILIHAFKSIPHDNNNHNTETITIQIADTGLGKIDVHNQEVYFQPFNQTTRNWLSAPDGIGLGLCLSRDFARQMGGDLRFINPANLLLPHSNSGDSPLNQGWHTCIELTMPVSRQKNREISSKSTPKHLPTTPISHSRPDVESQITKSITAANQIVLIDDNQTNIELLTLILQQLGHQNIKSFTNSITGQDYIMKHAEVISHAIIDIRMPRKNGLDLLTELAPLHKHINFILLTALNHDDIRVAYNQIRANNPSCRISLLFKPIDCAELKKLITHNVVTRSCTNPINKPSLRVSFV